MSTTDRICSAEEQLVLKYTFGLTQFMNNCHQIAPLFVALISRIRPTFWRRVQKLNHSEPLPSTIPESTFSSNSLEAVQKQTKSDLKRLTGKPGHYQRRKWENNTRKIGL